MKIRKDYTCPLEIIHDIIKGKWKTIIIFQLGIKQMSLSELQNSIEKISQKMLLEHLNELQHFDIVRKKKSNGYPLSVKYFLTERGKKLFESVKIMQEVGLDYILENTKNP